jgi:type I restriction enzyme S subunit
MSSSKKSPQIRFPEFKEPWAEERLDFFFSSSRAKGRDGLPTLSVTLDRGLIDRAELDRKMETNLGPDEHLLVREKDIAYNMMRMWQGAFGRSDREGIVSPAYVVIRPKSSADSAYFAYAFRRNRSIYLFWAYSYGITNDRLRLYADDFLRIPFRAPKVPEQQKIAAFLTAVDGRIEQLGRKKALLEATKKGVMQQLFTQTLRFQDDHGHDFPDWEEKTLKTICSTFKSGNGITADEIQDSGTYPVYGGNGLRGYTDRFTHEGEFVLIGRQGALCGNINRTSGKSYISEHAIAVAGNHLASTDWLEHRLNHMKLNRLSESSAQPGLAVNKLEKLKLLVPSLPEQTKIAGFLSALDGKIAAVGEQMRQTQAWKKGLLQQMFV